MDDPALGCPARHQFHQSAGGNVIAHHHAGQVGDADPGHHRVTQRQQVIGDHSWRMPNHRAGAVGPKQFPLIFTLRRTPVQARQTAEVGRGGR